ncbi:MAG TPA: acyltransferase [Thermomicrobiales bacterium]|nr:acyltransferase [Thermomicrobiales bacterium]
MRKRLQAYISTQASNTRAYLVQETVTSLFSWMPSLPGIAARAAAYRLILHADSPPAIEASVRLCYTENIRLGRNVYIDHGSYLHACPGGITIGDDTLIMHGTILHVYNFRDLPNAGIAIGARCIVGEMSIIRGQGGVSIGDDVLIAPKVQILAVEHIAQTTRTPIIEQGLRASGIVVDTGAWIGAGAIITDGVRVGRNAVVGAGAVVTRDVPDGAVAVGVPARVIRVIDDCDPPIDVAPPILKSLRMVADNAARTGQSRRVM